MCDRVPMKTPQKWHASVVSGAGSAAIASSSRGLDATVLYVLDVPEAEGAGAGLKYKGIVRESAHLLLALRASTERIHQ